MEKKCLRKKNHYTSIQKLTWSSRVLDPLLWTLLLCSPCRYSIGFRSGDWDVHDIILIFWSSSIWKIQSCPSCSFLAEATRFSYKITDIRYFMESMMYCILTRLLEPLEEKQPRNLVYPPPNHVLFCITIHVFTPNPPWVFVAKKLYFCIVWP